MKWNKENKEYFGSIFKQINSKFERCFWPKETCTDTAIRAHSIQNSDVLDLLCENNHLIMPKMGIDIDTGPFIKFEEVGRNKATTFTGLCDKHDSQLFEPIDKNIFSPHNQEHLFLMAYRSVLRELHAKMKSGVDIQTQYMRGVDLGRFNPDVPDPPMMMATMGVAEAYMFYLYKFYYDQVYLNRDFNKIEHQVEFIGDVGPTIAVSSVYSYIDNMRLLEDRHEPKCMALNIFPQDNGLYLIFSYRMDQRKHLLPYISHILQAERFFKLYLISKLVLMYCENFVMRPSFYNDLPDERKKAIRDYFMNNIWGNKNDKEDNDLYLFH
ncbi:MAG TPA: hypothetical protein ENL10_01860 [Candidatus Cloacimonetes bacterium]|nr:MAG: hypothetical protein DRH50_14320 [Deltaproteobacteria bacterium]HHE40229.1 hypothetical protein [Candidatus Cloacimonadota bacterium]